MLPLSGLLLSVVAAAAACLRSIDYLPLLALLCIVQLMKLVRQLLGETL